MVLQFNEAPDYASILERDYEKQNRGFARREEAERANDQRRIQNAGVPLELITSLISFSGTAKKMADGIKAQQNERQLDYYVENMSTWTEAQKELAYDKYEKGIDILDDDYKVKWKIAHKINEEGKFTEALELVENSEYKKGRFGFLQAKAKKHAYDINTNFTKSAGDISGLDADEVRVKIAQFKKEYWNGFREYPEALELQLKKRFNEFEAQKLSEVNKKDNEAILQRYENERLQEWEANLLVDDAQTFEKNAFKMFERIKAEKNFDTLSEAIEYAQEDILKLVESNVIPESVARKFEAVSFLHRGKKGQPREKILEAHSKTFSTTDWDNRLTKASANATAIRDQNKLNYQKQVEQNIQAIEDEQGFSMTTTQLAEYLKQNYDPSKGGPIPDGLTNRLTKEKADDKELVKQLQHKWDNGIPFSKAEVMKLNDRTTENTWLQKVTETNPNIPPKEFKDEAFGNIPIYANAYTKETDGNRSKTVKWKNIENQAKRAYMVIYARRIKTAPSADVAQTETLKELQANINAGIYNELPGADPEVAKTRAARAKKHSLSLIAASEAIALNEDIVNTGIIYGSEDIVKEAKELPDGEVHIFYNQLGKQLGINGHKLQYRQLEIASELKGEGKPVKSKILQEYEKLDTTTQELLSRHTSPAKVQRAIINEYGKDGDISYNDVGVLIDEVLTQEEKKPIVDEDWGELDTTETVIEQSTKASMAPSPRTTTRPEGEVALLDKPEVKEAIDILVDRAKSLLPEVFYGKETSQALMSDITKSLEKQKEKASKRQRRRGR